MTPAQEAQLAALAADELKINLQGQAAAQFAARAAENGPSPSPENIKRLADACDMLFGVYPEADGNPAIGLIKGHGFLIAMLDNSTSKPRWNAIACESPEYLAAIRDRLLH